MAKILKVFILILGIFMGTPLMTKCIILQQLNSPADVCRLFPDGGIMRKPGSCKETIKCVNGKSTANSVTCNGSKIVKLDKMICADVSSQFPDQYCTPTCTKASPTFIEDVKNCNEWTQCDGAKIVKSGVCPQGQIFQQDEQRCNYGNDDDCKREFNICDVAQTNQRFWDENNCHEYFICNSKRNLISQKCPIATYYDVRTGECVKKAQVNCYKHPVPEKACGTRKLALLNRFIADQATCRGYFYCKDLGRGKDGNYIPDESPRWGQCRMNEFFDAATETCRSLNNVKCDEDRCDSRNSGKILSQKSGCQHYLICKDGYTADEIKCPDNKYFDPTEEVCVDREIYYPICN